MKDLAVDITEIDLTEGDLTENDLNRDDLTILEVNTRHTTIAGLLS